MKISSAILVLTLTLNGAFAGYLLLRADPTVPSLDSVEETLIAAGPIETATDAATAGSLHATEGKRGGSWQRLHASDDLAALVARLRSAGYPSSVLRAMIRSLVSERFDAERSKVDAAALNTPFWKMWPNSYMDPKTGPALRQLQKQQEAMVQQLLGEPATDRYATTEEGMARLYQEMGDVPLEKLERLNAYADQFNERRLKIFSEIRQGRAMLQADRKQLAEIDQAMRAGLTEILTPEEATEYLFRGSTAANQLKWMLDPAAPTEAEFRTLFPLYQAYQDHLQSVGLQNDSQAAPNPVLKVAEETMQAQLTAALGEKRAAELQLALDPRYQRLNRLVGRLDLPLSASKQVLDVQIETAAKAAAIRGDTTMAATVRTEKLSALEREVSERLSAALGGDRGLNAYKQNGGEWISGLTEPKK